MQAPAFVNTSLKSKYSEIYSVPLSIFHKLTNPILATAAIAASFLTLFNHGDSLFPIKVSFLNPALTNPLQYVAAKFFYSDSIEASLFFSSK
jgi:hypothetical protein